MLLDSLWKDGGGGGGAWLLFPWSMQEWLPITTVYGRGSLCTQSWYNFTFINLAWVQQPSYRRMNILSAGTVENILKMQYVQYFII
jgi:hypothetical protein